MRNASFANLDLGGGLEESCPVAKLSKIPSRTYSGKREEEKPQKRRKEKGTPHQPGGAVCQGFAGENYARRASFSTCKRRSRLTLTGRRRQATFAGVFVFEGSSLLDRFYTISPSLSDLADFFKIQRTVVS